MKLELNRKLTPTEIAEAFCELNDEEQADVFIHAAKIASGWGGPFGDDWQWMKVGQHLQSCTCSTDGARSMIQELFYGLTKPTRAGS